MDKPISKHDDCNEIFYKICRSSLVHVEIMIGNLEINDNNTVFFYI